MTDRRVPHCGKCGNDHYNFAPCPARQDLKPEVEWRPNSDWGNQLGDLKHLGGNTFVQRREFDR